jgi:DNA mismatch repair protein MutS2
VSVAESNQEGAHVTRVTSAPSVFPGAATAEVLRQLEFARALDAVAARAVGPLGGASVRGRLPSADLQEIRAELATVAELQRLLVGGDAFRPEPIADLAPLLDQIAVPGTVLDGAALLELGRGLEAMRLVAAELQRVADDAPRVAALGVAVPPPRLARDILQAIEPDGRVRDGADPGVDRARSRLRDARAHLIQLLERTLRGLAAHEAPPDASVTVRGGRYVIPVTRDARGRVPGIVHAESASGATLFVEPQAAVELGNALNAAEADEGRAVLALLRRLTEAARPHVGAAAAGLAMCVAADDLYARARYATDVQAAIPTLTPAPGPHVLRDARHPLLLAEGVAAVPFDLELEADELALVVSGPNTGGKTVLLKAVGLASALVQAGVVPPLGDGSALPVYRTIASDIGDNQSIAASLSTFSAHLHALREALAQAGPAALVLLDEIGSGTDPVEGAALAAATLQTLVERGSRVVATTHLSDLKRLAAETPGVVNASLHFDAATLTPTYRLVKGIPGRSYGLVIARRLGLPPDVLDRAERRTPEAERSLDAILADVERRAAVVAARETELDTLAAQLGRRDGELANLRETLAERERAAATRTAELEREGREHARRFLLEARKRVEEALGAARAAVTEATAREARRLVEQGIREEADALKKLEDELASKGWRVKGAKNPAGPTGTSRVVHRGRIKAAATGADPAASAPRAPAATAVSEIDLRGMTADEAREAVDRAVDAATLADLPAVRIIHGKGTGVLRQVVDELLRADRRIAAHRLAPPREGGTGVTIAELA